MNDKIKEYWREGPCAELRNYPKILSPCLANISQKGYPLSRYVPCIMQPWIVYISSLFLTVKMPVRCVWSSLIESVCAGVTVPRIRRKGLGREQCRINTPRAHGVLHRAQSRHFDTIAGFHIWRHELHRLHTYRAPTLNSVVFIRKLLQNVQPVFDKKVKVKLSLCSIN